MNKKEAAAYLGRSTRAVERAVAAGKLGVRYHKERHGYAAVFDPSEVRRYRMEIEDPFPRRPHVEPPVPMTPVAPYTQPTQLLKGFAGTLEARPSCVPSVSVVDKITLSLAEASALSGLSEDFLLQAIRDKQLKAFKHGLEWRIKRADLDVFVRDL